MEVEAERAAGVLYLSCQRPSAHSATDKYHRIPIVDQRQRCPSSILSQLQLIDRRGWIL